MCAVGCEGARQAGRVESQHTALRGAGSPRTGSAFAQPSFPGRCSCRNSTATAQLSSSQPYSLPTLCSFWVPAQCLAHRGVHSLSPASHRSCQAELLVFQLFGNTLGALGCSPVLYCTRNFEIKSTKTQGTAQRSPCKSHLYFLS